VRKRGAFTLLELIIVIFLLSLLSLVVGNIRKVEAKKEIVGVANIPFGNDNNIMRLICVDECHSCLLVDERLLKPPKGLRGPLWPRFKGFFLGYGPRLTLF